MRPLLLRYYLFFSAVCIVALAAALVLNQLALLLIPFAAVALLLACHRPHLIFYALVASIPWSIEYNVTPSLGTDLPDEPLMLLTCFSVAAFLLANAKRKPLAELFSPLGAILLLQVVWYILVAICSTDVAVSIKFLLAKSWYIGAFVVAPFILFREKRHLKNSALLLFISMMLFTVVALLRHVQYGLTFEKINASLQPFFRNHVNYSALLVCMMPLLLLFYKSNQNKTVKMLLGILFPVVLLAVFLSYARGAWLALIVAVAAYWLLRRRWLFRTYVITFALVFVGLFWLIRDNHYLKYAHDYRTTIFHTNFKDHLIATYQLKDVSTAERFYRWIAGVRMVKDNWMTGYGPNTFY
ncbi:MAG: O-antigen ligase family protein, partial [Flaviaesturariibacter sp.]|nr:O-antigen ligase family protein [Flaviaesturariibacter sp.]